MPKIASYRPLQTESNDEGNPSNLETQPGLDFMCLFSNSHADMLSSELTLCFDPALYESQYLPWD